MGYFYRDLPSGITDFNAGSVAGTNVLLGSSRWLEELGLAQGALASVAAQHAADGRSVSWLSRQPWHAPDSSTVTVPSAPVVSVRAAAPSRRRWSAPAAPACAGSAWGTRR